MYLENEWISDTALWRRVGTARRNALEIDTTLMKPLYIKSQWQSHMERTSTLKSSCISTEKSFFSYVQNKCKAMYDFLGNYL